MKRQITVPERLQPGDVLLSTETPAIVMRVTGSPGAPPKSGNRLMRVFCTGMDKPLSMRQASPVHIFPRSAA